MAICVSAVARLPRRTRLILLAAAALLALLAVYSLLGIGSGTLKVVFRHDLQAADVALRIDGKLVYSGQLSGTMKRRLPFFEKAVATSAQTLALSAGDHLVEVRVQSPDGDYDQTRSCSVNLPSGQQGTLVVNSLRGGLSLAYQGVPAAPSGAPGSDYSGYLRSILVTVLGSAVSAAIGFAVQEALRARKATASVQNPAGKDVS